MDQIEAIRKAGWRQGAFVSASTISGNVRFNGSSAPVSDSWFMVITQDCDLVHHDFAAEPMAELLLCKPAPEEQPAWKFGRDPRRLQFAADQNASPLLLNAAAADRAFVERIALAGLEPEATLTASSATVQLIAAWLANRYVRPAFPDAFNNRLKPVEKKIGTILKTHTRFIERIFLRVHPDHELPDEHSYTVDLWLVMKHDDWGDITKKTAAGKALGRLESLLSHLPGITLSDIQLKPESEVSLDDVRALKPWNYDYITYRDEAGSTAASST